MQTPGDGDLAGDLGQIPYKETQPLSMLEARGAVQRGSLFPRSLTPMLAVLPS